MSDSERITAYSKAVKNFDLIHDLPPKNEDIDRFTPEQKVKFEQLCSKDSFLVPVVHNNQISHFEINKRVLKNKVVMPKAEAIYRKLYLRNTHNMQEKATFIIINFALLMLCVLISDSESILLFVKDEALLNIIAASTYLAFTITFLAYYLSVNFLVFAIDVINDIALGITETHPTLIGYKA